MVTLPEQWLLHEQWLDGAAASTLAAQLRERSIWHQERLRLYGREVTVPRLVAWSGEAEINYRYSGTDHLCDGWLPELACLRQRLLDELDFSCNLVLLNRYRDGRDYMGWHRDDERGHGTQIASVSLGATRHLLLRPDDGRRSHRLDLTDGSLLLMDGRIPHSLPKVRRADGERINLTFRRIGTAAP